MSKDELKGLLCHLVDNNHIKYWIEKDSEGDSELTVKLFYSELWIPLNVQRGSDSDWNNLCKDVMMYIRNQKLNDLGI